MRQWRDGRETLGPLDDLDDTDVGRGLGGRGRGVTRQMHPPPV